MLCEVCNENSSKYKCSTCFCPYCSLNCWKNHKNQGECRAPPKGDQTLQVPKIDTKYFTEDTVSIEKLSRLGESDKIREILKNRYLQNTLISVDNAENPEKAVFEAMKDPDFVNFVDECLKLVENQDE